MSKQTEQEKADAIKQLRSEIKPGTTLRTILRHVTKSGMSRSVSVIQIKRDGSTYEWDYLISKALDTKIDEYNGGLKVGGCGFDAQFEIVYRLSLALYGGKNSYACKGAKCPSNSHSNDRNAPRGKGVRHTDGYALSQRSL
jgi:hypothetical protein